MGLRPISNQCECSAIVNNMVGNPPFTSIFRANICNNNCLLDESSFVTASENNIIFNSTVVRAPSCVFFGERGMLVTSGKGFLTINNQLIPAVFILRLQKHDFEPGIDGHVFFEARGFDQSGNFVSINISRSVPNDENNELTITSCSTA